MRLNWPPLRFLLRDTKWQDKFYRIERGQGQILHREQVGTQGPWYGPEVYVLPCTGMTRLTSPVPPCSESLNNSTVWTKTLPPGHHNWPSFHLAPTFFFHWLWPPSDTNIHTMNLKAGLSLPKVLLSKSLTFSSLNTPSIYQAQHLVHNDI